MTTYEITFTPETCKFIEAFEEKNKRVRKAKINDEEMARLIRFVSKIADKYQEITEDINLKLGGKKKDKKSKIRRKRFTINKKDGYVIDRIIESNKLHIYPKIMHINGSTSKKYDFYQIRKIARIFYVALNKGISTTQRLLEVPDVHFAIIKIMQDEYGELKKFLEYEV